MKLLMNYTFVNLIPDFSLNSYYYLFTNFGQSEKIHLYENVVHLSFVDYSKATRNILE